MSSSRGASPAPPKLVFRAHTEPKLLPEMAGFGPRWMDDAEMHQRCEARSNIRFEWADGNGNGFHLAGGHEALSRLVHVERMHLPDPTPDNHVETTFDADGGGTLLTLRMTLPDAETRRAMLATGMEDGMEASYAQLNMAMAGVVA